MQIEDKRHVLLVDLTFVLWDGFEEARRWLNPYRTLSCHHVVGACRGSLWPPQKWGHAPPSLHSSTGVGVVGISSFLVLRASYELIRLIDHHPLRKHESEGRRDRLLSLCAYVKRINLYFVLMYFYLLILLERISKRVQALRLVRVDLSQRRRHHFEVFLIVSHLSHWDAVQIV